MSSTTLAYEQQRLLAIPAYARCLYVLNQLQQGHSVGGEEQFFTLDQVRVAMNESLPEGGIEFDEDTVGVVLKVLVQNGLVQQGYESTGMQSFRLMPCAPVLSLGQVPKSMVNSPSRSSGVSNGTTKPRTITPAKPRPSPEGMNGRLAVLPTKSDIKPLPVTPVNKDSRPTKFAEPQPRSLKVQAPREKKPSRTLRADECLELIVTSGVRDWFSGDEAALQLPPEVDTSRFKRQCSTLFHAAKLERRSRNAGNRWWYEYKLPEEKA